VAILITDPVDIELDENGDLKIYPDGLRFISGIAGVAQAIRIALGLYQGEWFLNMDAGMPYYQQILGDPSKQPNIEQVIRANVQAAILAVQGVVSIPTLEVSIDPQTRAALVTWVARTAFGDTPEDTLALGTVP